MMNHLKLSERLQLLVIAGGMALALALALTGCGTSAQTAEAPEAPAADVADTTTQAEEAEEEAAAAGGAAEPGGLVSAAIAADMASMDFAYSKRDRDPSYDAGAATAISVDGGGVQTISAEGTYVVSGNAANGQIVVAAPDDAKVQIVLDGVDLTCDDGPCIWVRSADKVFLTLADGSTNTLSDGSGWSLAGTDDEPNATVYSKCDLTVNGGGSLTVNARVNDGIGTRDDLVITGGTIAVSAADDGLRGKDSVKIGGGDITVNAGGDGIKSSKSGDEGKGFVYISDGAVRVTAEDDGIDAERLARIVGGTVSVNAADDGIHSELDACVEGGQVTVLAGDDGVHAEYNLSLGGGTFSIEDCYEGLEAQSVEILGGDNTVYAQDDGINASAADGDSEDDANEAQATSDFFEGGGRGWGGPMGDVSEECSVTVSGGTTTLVCTRDGDSIDSNGSILVTGGEVYVSGTTQNDNGAIDSGTDAVIEGGTIIALASNGMAESFGASSTQPSIVSTVSGGKAGDEVTISTADGTVLVSYQAENAYSWLLASTPAMTEGGEYVVTVNGTDVGTLSATTASQGNGMGAFGGGDMRGRGEGFDGQVPNRDGQDGFGGRGGGMGGTPPDGGMGPGSGRGGQGGPGGGW